MKINKTEELLNYDILYGYCPKTTQWEEVKQINEVKNIDNRGSRGRWAIKGTDTQDRKIYFQVGVDVLEKLKQKFTNHF